MFGQLIFADIPFADHGDMPVLDTGWHLVEKSPCESADWTKRSRGEEGVVVCDVPSTDWRPAR